MNTFLRLELTGRRAPGEDVILLNVDHIVRIHPCWPQGSSIVLTDDTSLNVRASIAQIQAQITASNGRIVVKEIGH